jgi:hypothetical protein
MDFVCYHHVLSLAPNCFLRPREARKAAGKARSQFGHIDGDHLVLLNVYHWYKQSSKCITIFFSRDTRGLDWSDPFNPCILDVLLYQPKTHFNPYLHWAFD